MVSESVTSTTFLSFDYFTYTYDIYKYKYRSEFMEIPTLKVVVL